MQSHGMTLIANNLQFIKEGMRVCHWDLSWIQTLTLVLPCNSAVSHHFSQVNRLRKGARTKSQTLWQCVGCFWITTLVIHQLLHPFHLWRNHINWEEQVKVSQNKTPWRFATYIIFMPNDHRLLYFWELLMWELSRGTDAEFSSDWVTIQKYH